jgi:putative aldouronate transport system substrate-binding protein
MKKAKIILALLLAVVLTLTLFAACSKPAGDSGPSSTPSGTSSDTPSSTPSSTTNEPVDPEDIENIRFFLIDMYGVGDYDTTIEDAINAITEKQIGVHVDIGFYGMGDYNNNLSMAIGAGEAVDLACIWVVEPCSVTTMYAQKQLMEITDILDQYGPNLKALVGDYLGAYTINGGLYGIPTYRNFSSSVYLTCRTDVLEELGMKDKYYNMKTFTELEELLMKVKETTDYWPMGSSIIQNACGIYYTGDNFKEDIDFFDLLGDSLYVVHADADGKVEASIETDSYLWSVKKMVEWQEKGLLWPEHLTNDEHTDQIMKQNVIFSNIQPCEIGAETAKSATTGFPVSCITMGDITVMTADVNKFGVGIPITAEAPEAAMKFLDLIYNSKELMNIIDWGIEGSDWVMTETGEADYVDGDSHTARYHNPDFIFGNYFLAEAWKGDGGDFREVAKATNDAAPKSRYLGFVLNTEGMDNIIAGISSVRDEFKDMVYGGYNEDHYNDYIRKMEGAGLRDYISAVQTQLDAFLGK